MAQAVEGGQSRIKTWYVTFAAIALSIVILVIITSVSGINPTVIFTIPPIFLLGTISAVALRLLLTGIRFNYILRALSDRKYPFFQSLAVRIGSEFVALTSPAYVGGEVARAAWIVEHGEASGKAMWLPYVEIVFDVYAGYGIAVAAGVYALLEGYVFLGVVVMAVSLGLLTTVTSVVLLSRKGLIRMPSFMARPLRWVVGELRAQILMEKGDTFLKEFCEAADITFTRKNSLKLFVVGIYTLGTVILAAATLWLISVGLGLHLSLLECAPVVYAAIVLGNLPITLGGSGVVEASVYFFTSQVFGVSSWPMVFAWRILTYHFVLVITGICGFVILHRYSRSNKRAPGPAPWASSESVAGTVISIINAKGNFLDSVLVH